MYADLPSSPQANHYDSSNPSPVNPSHLTEWTLLIYLSDGVVGGETVFHLPGKKTISVQPTRGMALLHKHGGHDCLLHEGAVVKKGRKWVLRSDVLFGWYVGVGFDLHKIWEQRHKERGRKDGRRLKNGCLTGKVWGRSSDIVRGVCANSQVGLKKIVGQMQDALPRERRERNGRQETAARLDSLSLTTTRQQARSRRGRRGGKVEEIKRSDTSHDPDLDRPHLRKRKAIRPRSTSSTVPPQRGGGCTACPPWRGAGGCLIVSLEMMWLV
jgi:hypothetical protein